MQVPGGRMKRGASADVYTALMVMAVVFLAAACIVMWTAGGKVGKDGSPFGLQDAKSIQIK